MHNPVKGKRPSKTSKGVGKKHRTKGRKDHYLPQGYLRGFISPSRAGMQKPLWFFDVRQRTWSEVSTAEIGYEMGFYDYRGPGTPVETPDQVFAEMERTFPLILDEMVASNFARWFDHRDFLLRYFQMTRARSPLFFEQQLAQSKNTQAFEILTISEDRRKVQVRPKQLPDTYHKNKAIADMIAEIQKGVDWLDGFDWALRYCSDPEDPFIVSDTACVVEGTYPRLEASIFALPDTLIFFPLCWQACLVGSRRHFYIKTERFASRDLKTMRQRHRDFATRYIVSPTRFDEWQSPKSE